MGYKIKGDGVLQIAGLSRRQQVITSADLSDELVEKLKKTHPKVVEQMIEKDGGKSAAKKEG